MSSFEYLDLFRKAQTKKCPYRAFYFDVIGSKLNKDYQIKHFELCNMFTKELVKRKVLKVDEYNEISFVGEDEKLSSKARIDNNLRNPMILGDGVCYFVNNGAIEPFEMIELFVSFLKKLNIPWNYHFQTALYETDKYAEGGEKMYKGYMFPIIESLEKTNSKRIILNKNTTLNDEEFTR